MVQPINVRAINQGIRRWPINSTTNLAGAGGGLSAYAVNDNEPDTVADFAGVLNSGTEYYRVGGSETTFASMFTYTGASNKVMTDSDGNLKWAPHNLLTYSNTFDNAAWTKSNCSVASGVSDPDGGASAWTLTATANGGFLYQATSFPTGSDVTNGIWVRRRTGTGNVELRSPNNTTGNTISVTSEWQLFGFESDSNNVGSVRLSLATNGDAVDIYAARVYRSSLGGMVNNPDRGDSYVPTTSAAVYFPRRNHYRGGSKKGILLESAAATNLALHNRDFTNAAWSKTNMTAAKTATGIGGVTNSASTLTATAGNATALQAITSTSAARVTSMWIKRRTGTGNIEMTQDNGSTWTAVTVTAGWTRVYIPAVTSANPTVGIRIVTSGDAVDVDLFQHEVGSIPTSEIATTSATATRAAETLTIAGSNMAASTTAMSFHMQGEISYADTGSFNSARPYYWIASGSYINVYLDTQSANTGQFRWTQYDLANTASSSVLAADQLTPGVNVSFNIASRHLDLDVGAALNGSSYTPALENANLNDLSSGAFQVGAIFNGSVSLIRQWDADLTDTGIEACTS